MTREEARIHFETFGVKFTNGYGSARVLAGRRHRLDEYAFSRAHEDRVVRQKVKKACAQLSPEVSAAMGVLRERVRQDKLPLLSLPQVDPLNMQSSHLSFQEFFAARAICKGKRLAASAVQWPPRGRTPWTPASRWARHWARLIFGSGR